MFQKLRSLFQRKSARYELSPPPYKYKEVDNTLPTYEDVLKQNKEQDTILISKNTKLNCNVAKAINKITSGEVDYIRLDNTTVKPMQILNYFLDNGASSHKDVFVLFVKSSPETKEEVSFNGISQDNTLNHFYLISRKVKVTTTILNFGLTYISDESFSLISINLSNSPSIAYTNFIADDKFIKERTKYISEEFEQSLENKSK